MDVTLSEGGNFTDKVGFIWSVADLLRGDYKQSEYGRVILPLVVVRRLDCVLADTRDAVRDRAAQLSGKVDDPEQALCAVAGRDFYNTASIGFDQLTADPEHVATHLREYLRGFSPGASEVLEKFRWPSRSHAWIRPGCSTKWSPGSPTLICTLIEWTTTRWARSTRS